MTRRRFDKGSTTETTTSTGAAEEKDTSAPDVIVESPAEETPAEASSEPSSAAESVDGSSAPAMGKNARKRAKRREELPRDNPFASAPKVEGKPGNSAPFPFEKYRATARNHAQLFAGMLDKYLAMRGACDVKEHGSGVYVVKTLTCADIGDVVYYTDKKHGAISGPIGEALAFHCVVAGNGSVAWLDGWIERHRALGSTIALAIGAVYLESIIRKNAILVEAIERRNRQSQGETESIDVKPQG